MPPQRKNAVKLPILPEDFYELTFVSDPQVSPDGKTVAWVTRTTAPDRKGYQNAVWVCDAQGKRPQQFSAGEKQDHTPRWSPDGQQLVFVSTRRGKPQLWRIPLGGGEARALTHLPNGATQPVWSPDGARLLLVSRVNAQERAEEDQHGVSNTPLDPEAQEKFDRQRQKEEAEKADPRVVERTIYRAGTEYFDDRRAHVYVLELASGAVVRLSEGEYDHQYPAWSADGRYVYFSAKRSGDTDDSLTTDLLRVPARGGRAKRVLQVQAWGLQALPSPDGKHLAYLAVPKRRASGQNHRLMVADVDGKNARRLAASVDAEFGQLAWRRDGKALLFTSPQRGEVGLYAVTLADDRVRRVLGGRRMVRAFSVAQQADCIALVASTPADPGDVFCCTVGGARQRRLSQLNAGYLAARQIQPVEELWYPSADGTQIQGWVIKPPKFSAKKKYPLAVEIHGGPHAMWSDGETTMWHEWQLLASAGYVVFFCNPRGSDGYGEAFKDAIHGDWGTLPSQDVLAGVDRLLARGYIDRKRICVTGGSYGGYLTAWLIGHDARFAAAASQRGVYDLLSFYGTTDVPRLIEWEFDAKPWEDPQALWAASPIAHAANIHTPLLILHSERDFRAPIPSAEGLYMALRKLGRKVKFVRFPEEGHELSRSGQPRRVVKRLAHILGWFDAHAKR